MENKCRSCLTLSPKVQYFSLLTVFPEFARKALSVLDLLSSVTSLKVELSNNLPSKICSECFKSLKLAYGFIVAFQNTQKIILQMKTQYTEGITKEFSNESQEISDVQVKIAILTEENDGTSLEQNCVSNIEKTDNSDFIKIISSGLEETMSDAASNVTFGDFADDLEKEIGMFEDSDDLEEDEINSIGSEGNNEESDTVFDDEVDKEIIEMEETIIEQIKPERKTTIPKNVPRRLVNCEFCSNTYISPKTLLAHIRGGHPERLMQYQRKLRENKVNKEPEIYKCDKCEKVFYTKSYLTNHNHNFHHPEWHKMYRCNVCNEIFQNRNAVRYHKLARHKGKKFTCNLCNKKFITPSTLKQHIIGVHEKTLPENYLCSMCGRGFKYHTALKYHMGKVHTNQRDFVCGYCGAAFILKGELRCHERNHTGERPFSCKYCKKTFKRSTEKRIHERIHFGIYPHKCAYCDKRVFTSSYNMKVHWLQHPGDCLCDLCGKGFVSEEILKFHYSHKHKIKVDLE